MLAVFLEFELKDIFNWVGGLIAFILFFVICAFIGQLGVQLRGGINILKFIKKIKTENKDIILNEKGVALKRKGLRKIIFPLVLITLVYTCLYFFLPQQYFSYTFIGVVPILLGYFGIILVPEQISELIDD